MNLVVLLLLALAAVLAVISLLRPRHDLLAVAVIVLCVAVALPLLATLGAG